MIRPELTEKQAVYLIDLIREDAKNQDTREEAVEREQLAAYLDNLRKST